MQQSSAEIGQTRSGGIKYIARSEPQRLILCYSVAEYAAPVWARSQHTHVLDSELNTTCKSGTRMSEANNVDDLRVHCLPELHHPDIRRRCMCSSREEETGIKRSPLSIWSDTQQRVV